MNNIDKISDMQKVIAQVEEHRIIAILRGVPKEQLAAVAQALYDGGIRLLEITYSANKATPDDEIASGIRLLAERFAGKMLIGAGTVTTKEQVCLTGEAGGRFIISPHVDPDLIRECKRVGLVSMPGAFTPTEIVTADRAGADFVKVFPVECVTPAYLKAVKGPLSHVRLLAVGGVDQSNIRAFLDAGAVGAGIGSCLVSKKAVAERNYEAIKKTAEEFCAAIR